MIVVELKLIKSSFTKRSTLVVGLLLFSYFHSFSQVKSFNVFGGSSLTVVYGNQSNFYQPTEILNQINFKLNKILTKFNSVEKSLDSLKVEKLDTNKKSFLELIGIYRKEIISKSTIIDSLMSSLKQKDKDLEAAKDLISQSEAVNESSKYLATTISTVKVQSGYRKIYSFKKSDIENNNNIISVYYLDEDKPTAVVKKFNRYGFINRSGFLIIGFKYEYAENFENNLALVVQGGKYGFISTNDKLVIPLEFDYALSFRGNRALVVKNGKWFFINKKGNKTSSVRTFKNGKIESIRYLNYKNRICIHYSDNTEYLASKNGKYIWHLIFPFHGYLFKTLQFKEIEEINLRNIYKLKLDDESYCLANKRLRIISSKYISDFKFDINNYAIVSLKIIHEVHDSSGNYKMDLDGTYNIINTKGKELLTSQYYFIDTFNFGFYPVRSDENRWGLVDLSLKERIKCEYDSIMQLTDRVTLAMKIEYGYYNDTLPPLKKYGVIDENGYTFIPVRFDRIDFVDNRYFNVSYNDKVSIFELIKDLKTVDAKCLTNCKDYDKFISSLH